MTTKMEKPRKAVTTEKEDAPAPRDPALCVCEGVQRRYDTDGPPVVHNGTNHYPCAKCGKLYA